MANTTAGVELHPNGKAKIKIREVAAVYVHVEEIPLEMYRNAGVNTRRGMNSLVTPAEVRAASDQWDGHSVLEDIDTQWGMIPEGGALDYCGYGSD
ncbi:hypothetical protein NM688_g7896 [Phlebia brevispora]|uniref:Uncharacterized protein n=1 Tax=Phlebia brevispora TaxID=194682 RepID=A0ACC1S054_9APHY|nr:hypothetical protein NM688_g7896 [Phlebia brevispora]